MTKIYFQRDQQQTNKTPEKRKKNDKYTHREDKAKVTKYKHLVN